MRKVFGVVLVFLLVFGVAMASADEIAGKIRMVDTGQRMLVLEDGTQLWVAEGVPLENLKDGASVKASYEERDGKKVATNIEVSE
jgi:hypothetical protein